MVATGQSIGHTVVHTTAVNDLITETQKLSKDPLLPRSVKPLLIEVDEAILCE